MSTLRVKKSFLKQVKVKDVIEELRADNYFFKSHQEMMACVKETPAYKQMREVAVKHMFNTLENTSGLPDKDAREEKKQQIAKIGLLALQINSAISKTIADRLNREATGTVKRALKKLSERSECSNSLNNRGRKRKQNDASSEISIRIEEEKKRTNENDRESDVSLDGISESVSSVHTSDLSSFDDEIVVSSEDEKGVKKEKRISFKTANKAYFNNGLSNVRNVVQQKDNIEKACKEAKTEKRSVSNASKKPKKSEIITPRPKRERKPNSKYSD